MITKQLIIDTTKKVLRSAILPNVILVPFLIVLHWIILSIWFYSHYKEIDSTYLSIFTIIGGLLPVVAYFLWGLRRLLIKAYLIIHNNIIQLWIHAFCKNMADKALNNDFMKALEMDKSSVIFEWKNYLQEKMDGLPSIIKRIIRMTLNKVGYSESMAQNIKSIMTKDTDSIANLLNAEVANGLVSASNLIIPRKVVYLIHITIIYYIFIWFL